MKKLRLLVTKRCPKSCEGCCNKDWDLDNLPIVTHFDYDVIMITGGEPLANFFINNLMDILMDIEELTSTKNRKIIIYTAIAYRSWILNFCNGMTLTIHNNEDMLEFLAWEHEYTRYHGLKSLRLNIFKGVDLPENKTFKGWKVKKDIEWIPNCPLPENEEFKRLKELL